MARINWWWGLVLVGLLSCGDPAAPLSRCDPLAVPSSPTIVLAALPGRYTMRFVANEGVRAGDSALATLELWPQQAALASPADGTTQPVVGRIDLDAASIGAADTGDPMAAGDSAPGVGVYVWNQAGTPQVLARIGSAANARGPLQFDGAWFTLFIERADVQIVSGSWRSGSAPAWPPIPEARGRFCADRTR
jgi:hypothetical protein